MMLYTKPTRIERPRLEENLIKWLKASGDYTKMAIFFDENFYDTNRNDEVCYKYMYLIYHMLAKSKGYFFKYEDYDKFAQYATNTIYMRFIRKQRHGDRVRSVLNYAKRTLYPLKVMFQKEEYRNDSYTKDESTPVEMQQVMRESVQEQYYEGIEDAIIDVLEEVPKMVRQEVNNTPYKSNATETKRLYMSVMLTLLKGFTLSNYNKSRYEKRHDSLSEESIIKMYNKERELSTTLWRLDPSIGDFVQLLANKIRKRLVQEIRHTKHSFELTDEMIDAILMSSWEGTNHSENDEESE